MDRKIFIEKIESATGIDKISAILDYSRYLCKTDPQESILQARKAYTLALSLKDDKVIISTYVHLSYANYYGGNYQKAKKWAQHLLDKGNELEIKPAIALAYNLIGSISDKQSNYTEAKEYLLKAIDIYLELNDKQELISCYNNLGTVHMQRQEFSEAETYLKLALQYAEELNKPSQNSIRMNLANLLFEQNKCQEALEVYQKSAEYFKELNSTIEEASALYNVAIVYSHMNENRKSSEILIKIYDIFKELNDVFRITETGAMLGSVLIDLGEYNKAEMYLNEALEIARKEELLENLAKIYKSYASLWEGRGKFEESNKYLLMYIDLMKVYYDNMHDEKLDELETKYKTQIFMLKNSELDEKNKIMQKQINELNDSLEELQLIHTKLKLEFNNAVERINDQDNLMATQSRMAVMGEMLSSIAHQWKQPLNVITVVSQSIEDAWDFDELDETLLKKQISMILSQINYMSETINDFRNFFKTEFLSNFSVKTAVDKSLMLIDYMIKKQNINIMINASEECYLSGNPNEITQVIVNILNNAIEAMQQSNIIDQKIKIELKCDEDYVTISIFNNGNPIPNELTDKIFEPYFTTRGKAGTGLGLSICKFIIENKYHGKVYVVNEKRGVDFYVRIPRTSQIEDNLSDSKPA